jgi:enediyne biosynthesis protein E4
VSQPFKRGASITAPGQIDSSLGEFWVNNPWDIVSQGHNLSAYERKRAFLNVAGQDFVDISFLTGADSDGDGRSVVAGDFRNDGRMDLVVRQVGGGPVLLFENRFPPAHYLNISLRGTKSNRLGIGARVIVRAGGLEQTRELYPQNGFRSQVASRLHFGLAAQERVDRLTIHWPSGEIQQFKDLPVDRHILVDEGRSGADAVELLVPGHPTKP